jgi:ribonuclease P protein component
MIPYTSQPAGCPAVRPLRARFSSDGQGQANVSTEQPPPSEGARVPAPHADPGRQSDPPDEAPQGPRAPERLNAGSSSLVRGREIRRVLDEGRPSHGTRVVVFLAPGRGRSAVVAGKKVGKAVQRNRARRVLRAAWPQVSAIVPDSDAVLVARAGILGAKTQDLVSEMSELLGGSAR